MSKDNNLKTFHEQKIEKKQSKLENEKNSEVYKEVLNIIKNEDVEKGYESSQRSFAAQLTSFRVVGSRFRMKGRTPRQRE